MKISKRKNNVIYYICMEFSENVSGKKEKSVSEINTVEAKRQRQMLLGINGNADVDGDLARLMESKVPEDVWEVQIRALVHEGIPQELGMTEQQYRASLPKLILPEADIRGRFPLPLLVEPRLLKKQTRGFDDDFDRGEMDSIVNRPGIKTPSVPYLVWANDGSTTSRFSIEQAMETFAQRGQERGLTYAELLALYRADTGLFFRNRTNLNNMGFDICSASSTAFNGDAPTIYHNYFDGYTNTTSWQEEFGEMQTQAFSSQGSSGIRPQGGWPSCFVAS